MPFVHRTRLHPDLANFDVQFRSRCLYSPAQMTWQRLREQAILDAVVISGFGDCRGSRGARSPLSPRLGISGLCAVLAVAT